MKLSLAISRWFQGYEMEVLIGRRQILKAQATINAHREYSDQNQAVTSVEWFLSKRAIWGELPVVVLVRRKRVMQGVVLLYYSTAFGVPYGLARSGRRGDASVIAPIADQRQIAEAAAQFLIQCAFAHTVILTLPYQVAVEASSGGANPGWMERDTAARWFPREDPQRLSLVGGLDATLQRLSYKLRRNLRYYQRRAADSQIRFVPDLSPEQRRDAVTALSDKGRYPTARSQARTWDRALQALPGAFAMGLQSARGDWLSYIVGWREPSATYIDWQLNNERESNSTVMRFYLLEHEAARQSPALVFVGGTSAIWQRACDPAVASDLLVTGTGPVALILRSAFQRLKPNSDVTLLYKRTSLAAQGNSDCTVGCVHFGVAASDGAERR